MMAAIHPTGREKSIPPRNPRSYIKPLLGMAYICISIKYRAMRV